MKNWSKRNLVCLYWSGYCTTCTHRCYPTTAGRGHFELLGFPPGPNRTSLDNLATSGSPKVSMLTPSLVRTLVQRVTRCNRTPVLKPSSNSSLPNAWITEPATDPSWEEWSQLRLINRLQRVSPPQKYCKHQIFVNTIAPWWIFIGKKRGGLRTCFSLFIIINKPKSLQSQANPTFSKLVLESHQLDTANVLALSQMPRSQSPRDIAEGHPQETWALGWTWAESYGCEQCGGSSSSIVNEADVWTNFCRYNDVK